MTKQIIDELVKSIKDPETLKLVLGIIMDLSLGKRELSEDTRLHLQAKLDDLIGGTL